MFFDRNEIDRRIRQSIVKSEKFIGQGEVASYIPELLNVDPDTFPLPSHLQLGIPIAMGKWTRNFLSSRFLKS